MASFLIHLAIASEYCKKNNIKDIKEFYKGSIAPDLVKDKSITHYTAPRNKAFLKDYLLKKVRLDLFLKNEKINNDYQKGVFLHLITDYEFFTNFFEDEYLNLVTYEKFMQDLYYSYDISNRFIKEKYEICDFELNFKNDMTQNITNTLKKLNINNTIGDNILPIEKLEKFIEEISNINIELYQNKVLNL